MWRRTLVGSAEFAGRGLHLGRPARVTVRPAATGAGIRFRRVDLGPDAPAIPALWPFVARTELATTLGLGGIEVATVEHLLAALATCGVTDAEVAVDGPEVPALDGSALDFVRGIIAAGLRDLPRPLRAIRILRPVSVRMHGRLAMLSPAPRFEMACRIRFADPAIGTQSLRLPLVGAAGVAELADSRSFGSLAESAELHRRGFARGAGLQCAVVVDGGRVLNPEGLRHPDEFVRHKMLDAMGDLALAGAPIVGRYTGIRPGHALTTRLLAALFADRTNWCWCAADASRVPGGEIAAPVPKVATLSQAG